MVLRVILWTTKHQALITLDRSIFKMDYLVYPFATTKDFIRFHIAVSQGNLDKRITVDSACTFAEWFFAAFTKETGTVIPKDERSAVYRVSLSRWDAFLL